jgi:hypothetical protein
MINVFSAIKLIFTLVPRIKICPHQGPAFLFIPLMSATAVAPTKQAKPGLEESTGEKTFRIRITLTSTKVKALEQGTHFNGFQGHSLTMLLLSPFHLISLP